LLAWASLAIRQRRLVPERLPARAIGLTAAAMTGYWLVRLGLRFGLGLTGFPAFPPP
jgi:hypothetical protein